MKKTKKGKNTKKDIVEIACELFKKHGEDKTSLNRIIEDAGISKGGFYHHFNSKKELCESVALKNISLQMKNIKTILENPKANAIKKINKIIPELHKLNLTANEKTFISPIIIKAIKQGQKEKHFSIMSLEEFVYYFLELQTSLKKKLIKNINNKRALKKELRFFQNFMEKILTTKKRSITIVRPLYKWYISLKCEL